MQVRIKDIMIEKGVSSVSLADMIGVSKVTVSNLINNKTMPSVETLDKIATALDVPMWQLFVSPVEVTGEGELTALIQHKGDFYKATTMKELKKIVAEIEESAE
nr:MAG TPA: helix-turn-helix domain protein [Caudoviricetes sp.]